jgi:tetratricopeptide (TPR) repeat protein
MEERQESRIGEAWPHGTVVLAWDAVRAGASDPDVGTNVVLHEFAHLLDYEDGQTNGAPLLDAGESRSARKSRHASWARVLNAEFEKLRAKAQKGEEVFLRVYGATNPAEFFAVATESFFEWPHEMKANSPELYEQLKGFYRQDPVLWSPAGGENVNVRSLLDRGAAKYAGGDLVGALGDYTNAIELKPDYAYAHLGRGCVKRAQGDLDGALADYDKAIALNPDEAATYVHRGWVKRALGDLAGAMSDFTRAIEIDPSRAAAYCNRGEARQANGDPDGALADYDKAIELNPQYLAAYKRRGHLRYNLQRFTEALFDFRKESEFSGSLCYADCRIWIVRARLGEWETATEELRTCLENVPAEKRDDWKSTIARFLTGQMTELDFFKADQSFEDKKDKRQRCEAWFYAGTKRLIDGDKATAMAYLEKCLAADKKVLGGYQSAAEAELTFLGAAIS